MTRVMCKRVGALTLALPILAVLAHAQHGPLYVECADTLAINASSILVGEIVAIHEPPAKDNPNRNIAVADVSVEEWLKGNGPKGVVEKHLDIPAQVLALWKQQRSRLVIAEGLRREAPQYESIVVLNLSLPDTRVFTEEMKILSDPGEILHAIREAVARHQGVDHVTTFPRSIPAGAATRNDLSFVTAVPVDAYLEHWAQTAVDSSDDGERQEAAGALGYFPSEANAARLRALLDDRAYRMDGRGNRNYFVREAATESLKRMEPTAGPPPSPIAGENPSARHEVEDMIGAFAKSHDAADGRKALDSLQFLTLGPPCLGDGTPCKEKKAESVPATTTLWLKIFAALDAAESELAKKLKTVYLIESSEPCGGMLTDATGLSDADKKKRCDAFLAENERNRLMTVQYTQVRQMRERAGLDFWQWAGVYKGNTAARDQVAKEAEALGCTPLRIEKLRAVVDAPDGTLPPHEELTPPAQ
jgi:hypothetical protein